MEAHFAVSLHLEPLLICISAGFTVQNFSKYGYIFMEAMERFALPIFVLFFSIAGASLNLDALLKTWPLAAFLVVIRTLGIFGSTWVAGILNRDSSQHRRIAWMAYITQAGVAIGLAQLAQRRFPELGVYLTTLVLAGHHHQSGGGAHNIQNSIEKGRRGGTGVTPSLGIFADFFF